MAERGHEQEWSDEEFNEFWYQIPGTEFLNESETSQLQDMLNEAFDVSINEHERLDENPLFLEFLEEFGMEIDNFPWEAFQEWIEDLYSEA